MPKSTKYSSVAILLLILVLAGSATGEMTIEELRITDDGDIELLLDYGRTGEEFSYRVTLEWWTTAGEPGYAELDAGGTSTRITGLISPWELGNLFDRADTTRIRQAVVTVEIISEEDYTLWEEYLWRP